MLLRWPVMLPLLLVLSSVGLQAQPLKNQPKAVQEKIASMVSDCRQVGGRPADSPGLLSAVDLTGDGLPDYVLDEGAFRCDGAASLFAGSGGSQVSVYVSSVTGQATKAFESGAFGTQIDQTSSPARLFLSVGGPLCGQRTSSQTARAGMVSCMRPTEWDAKSGKMQFAPVSQIRPLR